MAAVFGFVFIVAVVRAFEWSGCLVEEYDVTAHKEGFLNNVGCWKNVNGAREKIRFFTSLRIDDVVHFKTVIVVQIS